MCFRLRYISWCCVAWKILHISVLIIFIAYHFWALQYFWYNEPKLMKKFSFYILKYLSFKVLILLSAYHYHFSSFQALIILKHLKFFLYVEMNCSYSPLILISYIIKYSSTYYEFCNCIQYLFLPLLSLCMQNDYVECACKLSIENKVLIILKYLSTYHC